MIVSTALLCLSLNIFHESRGEPVMGRYAVALVTMNRAGSDKRVCSEVFKSKQFSWTSKVRKTPNGWFIPEHMRPRDEDAWNASRRIAQVTLDRRMRDFTHGAEFYHASYVSPSWSKKMTPVKTIGQHTFYVRKA
jgi:N-acetylmuramoyl-L-alanine amidase